jgi:GTP-binding protein
MQSTVHKSSSSLGTDRLPVVAIVGRPNAGKSTLFNRLLRQRKAVVDNLPGVTRDRNFGQAKWEDQSFVLVDTGGLDPREEEGILGRVQEQTRLAIAQADAIIFLFDGREGINPADAEAVDLLRRAGKPVFFAVNKIDGEKQEGLAVDFFSLGIERLFPISTAHGRGLGDLMDEVVACLPREQGEETTEGVERVLRVAIVGRPNVGKSSLLNRLVGFERSVVDATPGTTRDALDTPLVWQEKPFLLVDTAGIRRRSRIHERLEHSSVLVALKALERADIGLLLIDGTEGIMEQDARIAHFAWERGRGLVLVVNKWDAVPAEKKNPGRYLSELQEKFPAIAPLPAVFISALTGQRVNTVLPAVEKVAQLHAAQLPTSQLNRRLQEALRHHQPPTYRGRQPRLFYATQVSTRPPLIAIFTSAPDNVHPAYQKYLENQIRGAFGLVGTPVRLSFRARR